MYIYYTAITLHLTFQKHLSQRFHEFEKKFIIKVKMYDIERIKSKIKQIPKNIFFTF